MATETWSFNNDDLFDLVKIGRKTATCSLYYGEQDIPKIGEVSIIENAKGDKIKIKLTNVSLRRFSDIDSDWARKEGEGDLSLEYWKRVHTDFFIHQNKTFDENSKLVCEEFFVL